MKLNKVIGTISTLLFIIFAIVLIIQLIMKLTRHSPTEIQLLYAGMGAIASYLLAMSYKLFRRYPGSMLQLGMFLQ